MRNPQSSSRRTTGLLLAGAVLGLVAGLVLGPDASLTDDRRGDPQLVADTEAVIGSDRGLGAVSVARLRGGQTSYAGLGSAGAGAPTPQTSYELGSITKTFTGMLLADAVDRGEVGLDDPLQLQLRELAGTPAGSATLRQLATHTSGLPPFPPEQLDRLVGVALNDPPDAGWTTARLLETVRGTPVSDRGTYAYSNLGMSLLGHALARAAGTSDWSQLLRQRLLTPLGMTHTVVQPVGAPESPGLAWPHRSNSWPTAPWTSQGYEPAGVATRTTAADMMRFAQAVVEGRAPGMNATRTILKATDRTSVGLAWHTRSYPTGTPILWHNGGTGGTRTMLTLDLQARQAVLVMNNTDREVDGIAFDLITADRPGTSITPSQPEVPRTALLFLVASAALVVSGLIRGLRSRNRLHLITGAAETTAGVALALIHGPWGFLPGWFFGLLAGVGAAGVVLAGVRWRGLAGWPERRRGLALAGLIFTVAVGAMVVASG